MNTIFKRTPKGDEEIQKRTYKLPHVYRFVLIMIDGKSTVENIISRSSKQWNPNQCLYEMEAQGFIENVQVNSAQAELLDDIKINLILEIKKQLPKNHTKIVNKIINSETNHKSLSDAIDSACIFIKLTVSEEISKNLKQSLHKILDSFTET